MGWHIACFKPKKRNEKYQCRLFRFVWLVQIAKWQERRQQIAEVKDRSKSEVVVTQQDIWLAGSVQYFQMLSTFLFSLFFFFFFGVSLFHHAQSSRGSLLAYPLRAVCCRNKYRWASGSLSDCQAILQAYRVSAASCKLDCGVWLSKGLTDGSVLHGIVWGIRKADRVKSLQVPLPSSKPWIGICLLTGILPC